LKRKSVVLSFLFFVSWVLFFPCAVTAAKKVKVTGKGTPHLVIPQLTFETGKVIEGKEVSHAFVIKNKGSGTLIIKQVKPG
jgi:hypothetical protein